MFQHFVVKNFRGFAGLHLKNLARVNLIAGKNNTGKTALLEAIHLHNNPGDWQLPITINKSRGIDDPAKAMEDVCGWLFYYKHGQGGLDLSSWDEKGITRTLTIYILDPVTSRERYPDAEKILIGMAVGSRLVLKYEQTNEREQISIGAISNAPGTGLSWVGARVTWNMPSVYLSSSVVASAQDVKFFGELEGAKRHDEILPPLRILEPRLQRLALIPIAGDPVIHGDIGLPRLLPVPFMGEGMRRVLSLVLAIANAPGGVVLIDEVENGLHYSVMKDVWKAIGSAARQANVQIFATTHSWECIQAAHHAFKENGPYELGYYRLDRVDHGIVVKSMDEQNLTRVEFTDLEIR